MRRTFRDSLDLEQKPSADNQVKRICACTSERTKIAIRQLTSGEFMQSIKDEIFVSNYSTNDSRTIPPSHKMCDTSLYTKEAMFFARSPLQEEPKISANLRFGASFKLTQKLIRTNVLRTPNFNTYKLLMRVDLNAHVFRLTLIFTHIILYWRITD